MGLEMINRSQRYDINRNNYTKYKMCLSRMVAMCNMQHRQSEAEFIEKLISTEAELKKKLLLIKNCVI